MEKVTMQDIADKIGVSRISVWKAFNRPDSVSDSLRDKVMSAATELGYPKAYSTDNVIPSENHGVISVIVSRPNSSLFWTNIIHQVAKEFAKKGIDVLYSYAPSVYKPEFEPSLSRIQRDADGLIVLNIYDEVLLEHINKLEVPKVFLDATCKTDLTSLTGDVLLIEGIDTEDAITQSVIDKGCKRIGFAGDIDYAHTNYDRYLGFLQAMDRNGLEVSKEDCLTHFTDIYSYQKDISKYISSFSTLPDAIICASDHVAHIICECCAERNISPDDLILTGYDNSVEYDNTAGRITTADVDTHSLGSKLASELQFRISRPTAPMSKIYFYPEIIFK
jgi:LacI family transcriptional regulator